MKRRGFTLIELLVVVAIIALLIAILLPSLGKARELANRGTCAANVRGIAQSMHVYGSDNNDAYPSVPVTAANSPPTYKLAANAQVTGAATVDGTYFNIYSTGGSSAAANSPFACLWILCIRGDVAPKQFLCKSDPVGTSASGLLTSSNLYNTNFNDATNVANSDLHYSYSISYPWTVSGTSSAPGGWWKASSDAAIPILADMAPLTNTPAAPNQSQPGLAFNATTKLANSVHHSRDGQNISFADAHAEFQRSPFVGQGGDNIYTTGLCGPAYPGNASNPITSSGNIPLPWTGGSSGSYDTIMVPCANASNNTRF